MARPRHRAGRTVRDPHAMARRKPSSSHFTLDRQSGLPLYLQIAHELMYSSRPARYATVMLRPLSAAWPANSVFPSSPWIKLTNGSQARGVLTTRRGIGWEVVLIREQSSQDARERLRMARFVEETLTVAVRQGFDPSTSRAIWFTAPPPSNIASPPENWLSSNAIPSSWMITLRSCAANYPNSMSKYAAC